MHPPPSDYRGPQDRTPTHIPHQLLWGSMPGSHEGSGGEEKQPTADDFHLSLSSYKKGLRLQNPQGIIF